MAIKTYKLTPKTWTNISLGESIKFQVLEGLSVYWKYSTTLPTQAPYVNENCFFANLKEMYSHDIVTGELYVYTSDPNGAFISTSENTEHGFISTDNSTEAELGIDGTFTGEWESVKNYGVVCVSVLSDQASATDGLVIQWSANATDITNTDEFSILANKAKTFSFGATEKYVRIFYTNGSVAQTKFELTTTFKNIYVKPSSHRISDTIVSDDDAELVKSVLTGQDETGVFKNVTVSTSARLNTASQPYLFAISEGDILNHDGLLKFGTRTTVTAGAQSVVWEGTNALYTYLTSAEQLKVTSTSAQDGVGGTGFLTLTLVGLDANFDEITETITMNGITTVTTSNSFIRIFRAYGETCGSSLTNVGTITITNNAGTIELCVIPIGDGQTLMSIFTVPQNKKLFLTGASFSTNSNKGARVSLFTRKLDGGTLYPYRIRYRAFVFSGNEPFTFDAPIAIDGKTDIELRVTTPVSAGTTSCGGTFFGWYETV